jgi:hypothetical protein
VCCELVRVWRRLWALCTFVNVRRGSIGTVWYSPLRKHTPLNVPIRGSVTRSRCAAALRRLRCAACPRCAAARLNRRPPRSPDASPRGSRTDAVGVTKARPILSSPGRHDSLYTRKSRSAPRETEIELPPRRDVRVAHCHNTSQDPHSAKQRPSTGTYPARHMHRCTIAPRDYSPATVDAAALLGSRPRAVPPPQSMLAPRAPSFRGRSRLWAAGSASGGAHSSSSMPGT